MREAIGGTWLTQMIIIFMLVFVAFLALSLNYTKAFKMKNELLTIIEKQEGFTSGDEGAIGIINGYLKNNNYGAMKSCDIDSYGVSDLNRNTARRVTNKSEKFYYCVRKISAPSSNYEGKVYYKVDLFFYFNLPVLGDLFKFDINGKTNDIITPQDKEIEAQREE